MSQFLNQLPDRVAPAVDDLFYLRSAAGISYKLAFSAIVAGIPVAVAWGGITGVLANQIDLNNVLVLKAPLASPALTGVPLSTTAAVDTNTTQIATTAYVINQGYLKSASYTAADVLAKLITVDGAGSGLDADFLDGINSNAIALLASPTFTGVPAAPTAAVDTATTQLATTAFVINQGYAKLASPAFTGNPTGPTPAAGDNDTSLATSAFAQSLSNNAVYRTLLAAAASHIAGQVAGTYALANGNPAAVSGTGTLFPLSIIRIRSGDYPTIDGKAVKFRITAQIYVNDVAPTGNFTFGLYPVTTPATSGGAGVRIYTLGTVVGSSTVLFTTPAADGQLNGVSADFALPADGDYVIGVITTATVAVSSHLHMNAQLQYRNN